VAGVGQVHGEIPYGLGDPRGGGMRGGAQDADAAAGVLDNARTYMRAPASVTTSKKSAARIASAWERRNVAQVCEVRRWAGSMPASRRISQTVEAATLTPNTSSSPWMRRYPQELFSHARRSTNVRIGPHCGRPPGSLGTGSDRVAMSCPVAVPTQDGLGAHQQAYPPQPVAGKPVQQRREEGPVTRTEPHPLPIQSAPQDHDLVAEGEDLRVLGLAAHRQQPQHRQRVRHAQVRES
jgi:hypothetical protein